MDQTRFLAFNMHDVIGLAHVSINAIGWQRATPSGRALLIALHRCPFTPFGGDALPSIHPFSKY